MKGSLDVEGLSELEHTLTELPKATGKNVLRRVGRQALTPMMGDARQRAPDDPKTPAPNDLKSSLAISEKQKSSRWSAWGAKTAAITLFMGPTGAGYPQAVVQEFGAGPHFVTKGAASKKVARKAKREGRKMHPGHPPHPFMRPAWDHGWRALLDSIKALLWAEIEKAVARLARKAQRDAAKIKGG